MLEAAFWGFVGGFALLVGAGLGLLWRTPPRSSARRPGEGTIEASGGKIDFATVREFDCPSSDGDVQDAEGFPLGAEQLRRRLAEADALIICSPEYNSSMPGAPQNTIDWVSRYHPQPFKGKHCLLMSASPSMAGGNRGL